MQAPNNDQWERTKRRRFRNFLENPGFELSPIPEEEPSSPDSGSLPDLIVEPAPNRHDDPPEFYEGLERRMKQYYRKLFLGAQSDDDVSADSEVNRSMASTSKLDINTRKDKEEGDSKRETQIIRSISSDDDYNESSTHDDELIDTCATYNETSHQVISIDDSNKSSSIEAHSESSETDVNSNVNDNNEDNTTQPKATDEDRLHLQPNEDSRLLAVNEIEEIIDNQSVSEDSIQDCHKVSTTTAQIHQPRPERPQMVDGGSPVLMPRFIRFGRSVFGARSVGKYSGRSCNVLLASDEITTTFSPQTSAANELDNTDNDSSDEESSEDLGPIAHSTGKSFEDVESVELMREAAETRDDASWSRETSPASPALAFEAQTSAKELQDISIDSNEMNASHEESEAELSEDNNTLPHHDTGEITKEVDTEPSDDRSSNRVTDHTPVHNTGNFIEEFWSVSPIDVNIEDDDMNNSKSNKRKSARTTEYPPVKKKRDAAVQTTFEERKTWSQVKSDFFVGTPVMFRLCRCQDHVCS